MEEAIRFTVLAQSGRYTVTELCEQFGISRKTAYKHIERYAAGGAKALAPRSSRPHRSPSRTDEEVISLLLSERRLHRTWGPKKLRVVLETKHGITSPPACSTIADVLKRHGPSVRRRRRPGVYQTDAHGCTKATQPSTAPKFAAAAVASVRKWRFKPAMKNGVPVKTRAEQTIEFDLSDGSNIAQPTGKQWHSIQP